MRKLEPREELSYLQEIYGHGQNEKILGFLTDTYNTLQARAQTLLSLVTIILTIAGFSGPAIAASGRVGQLGVSIGVMLVVVSAITTLGGVLQLRWTTQQREDTVENSFVALLERRNRRTRYYHAAFILLVAGLGVYVAGLVSYVFKL